MRFDSDFNKTTNDACNLIYDQSEELKKLSPDEKDKILYQCDDAKVKLLNYNAKSYNYSQHIPRPVYNGAFKKDSLTGEDAKGASTVMCTELDQLQGRCVPIKYYVPEKPNDNPNFNEDKKTHLEEIKMGDIFSNAIDKQKVPLVVKILGSGVGALVNELGSKGSSYLKDHGLPGIEWYDTEFSAKYFPNGLDTNMENANKLFANPIGNLFVGGGTCNVGASDCPPLGSNYVIENEQNGVTKYIPVNNIPMKQLKWELMDAGDGVLAETMKLAGDVASGVSNVVSGVGNAILSGDIEGSVKDALSDAKTSVMDTLTGKESIESKGTTKSKGTGESKETIKLIREAEKYGNISESCTGHTCDKEGNICKKGRKGASKGNYICKSSFLGNARGLIPSISEDIVQTIEFPLKMVGILKSKKQSEYHVGSYNEINPSDKYIFILYCSQMEQLLNQILNGKNFTVTNGKEYYINILKKKLERKHTNIANFYSEDYDENKTYTYLKNEFDTFKKQCGLITGISDFPITKCCLYFYSNIIPDSLHGEYGVSPLNEEHTVMLKKIFNNEKLIQYLKRFLFPFNPNLFKNRIFVPYATSCKGPLNSHCPVNGQICTSLTRTETKHGKSIAGQFKMIGGLITNLFGEITGDSDKVLESSTICLDNVLKLQPTFDVAQVGKCSGKYCIVADQVCSESEMSCVSGERQDSKYIDNLKAFKYILDNFKTEYKNTYIIKPNKPSEAGIESFSSGELFSRESLTRIFYILLFVLFIYLIYNAQK